MRALVTGGDGFVGQHLLAHLLEAGVDSVAMTLGPTPVPGTLTKRERSAVSWHALDVRDGEGLTRFLDGLRPDRIYHLAGYSSRAEALASPTGALAVNAGGTLNLIEALDAANLRESRLVVAGSADAYGRGDSELIGERTPLRPESVYGATKAAQDVVARGVGRALGIDVRVARSFPLIGPGQREAFVLPSFCRRAHRIARGESEPVLRVGNLDVERDFTDVRDGIRALARLGEIEAPRVRAFNVCSGQGTTVRQLLAWVLITADIDPEIVIDSGLVREGEPTRIVGDPKRLREATGWHVERDLRGAVEDTFQWMARARPR